MGRKGVSKRKPKKNKSKADNNNNDASNTHPGESASVQSLVKNTRAIIKRGGTNLATESGKKKRKGK